MKGKSCEGEKRLENRVRNSSSSFTIMDLPELILREIFFRLPIASIFNCRRVCKEWCKILQSPFFTNNLEKNSKMSSFILRYDKYFMASPTISHFYLVEISDRNNGASFRTSMRQLLIPPGRIIKDHRSTSFFVVGSCRGLICVKETNRGQVTIYVSNPLTREFVGLPRHSAVPVLRGEYNCFNKVEYLFGFSSLAKSFKVMRIQHRNSILEIGGCKIFTVGVNERWRRCSNIPMRTDVRRIVFINEFFHWIDIDDFTGVLSINTFDIGNEVVGRILQPPDVDPRESSLGQLGGHLCLLDINIHLDQFSLWKLNEYGVAESWTKDVILSTWFPFDVIFRSHTLTLICLSEQGEIIFTDGRNIMSCNTRHRKGSELVADPISNRIASVLVYEPSFLSVKKQKRTSRRDHLANVS